MVFVIDFKATMGRRRGASNRNSVQSRVETVNYFENRKRKIYFSVP